MKIHISSAFFFRKIHSSLRLREETYDVMLCLTVEDSLTDNFWATEGFLDEPSGSMISPSESAKQEN